MNIFKKINIPTGDTKELVALENWTVKWRSRYGDFSHETTEECEVFTSREDANQFAEALRDAFKLLKYSNGTEVNVKRTK
jgi:hypothetical protein